MAHTPTSTASEMAEPTSYTIVTRNPPSQFAYQKLPEVCSPFGLNRSPSFQFIQRLKEFPPSMRDILIVASTSSEDIGLFTRSAVPLSTTTDIPVEKMVNVFTTTNMAEDSRRAQVPMDENMSLSTSVIGMAMDLSSTTKVSRPLPGEEMDESPSPLPALMILNNEGVLMGWWVVYAESIRQGTMYPGLTSARSQAAIPAAAPVAPATIDQPPAPAFGQSAWGTSTPATTFAVINKPAMPAFGTTSTPGAGAGAFGGTSGLGNQSSPWGAPKTTAQFGGASAFGQPTFGSAATFGNSTQGSAFGTSGAVGNQPSPWGSTTSAVPTATTAVFGQSGLGMRTGSTFGAPTTGSIFGGTTSNASPNLGSGGGFASFAKAPGFAASASTQDHGGNAFGQSTPSTSFASAMDIGSSFTPTPKKPEELLANAMSGVGGFVLSSAWKNENAINEAPAKSSDTKSNSLFGGDFEKTLGEAAAAAELPQIREADMLSEKSEGSDQLSSPPSSPKAQETTTPADTPAPSKFFSVPPVIGGLFGTQAQSKTTPAAVQSSEPAPSTLKISEPGVTTPATKSPVIKAEPVETPYGVSKSLPLPPNTVSKTSYAPGDSSASSTSASNASKTSGDDTPLPPDFLNAKSKSTKPVKSSNGPSIAADLLNPTSNPNIITGTTDGKPALPSDNEEPALPSDNEEESLDNEGSESPDNEGRESLDNEGRESLDNEGSGIDVAQEISPKSETNDSQKATPESSFGGLDKSPLGGSFTKVGRPKPEASRTLFGELGKTSIPFFPPPSKTQASPRSPSPIRSVIPPDVLRFGSARSASAFAVPQSEGINRKGTIGRSSHLRQAQYSAKQPGKLDCERLAVQKVRQDAEEEQDLSDREDERVREELATEVQPTTVLEPFIAHQDYVGNIDKPGIPGQIEKVYRDINSMIDTLGLNARSLEAFTRGHSEINKDRGRTREDLESDSDWCLIEIADLSAIENALNSDLDRGRLQHVQDKINSCRVLQTELGKIRTKNPEIKRVVDATADPDQIEALRLAPLSASRSAQQHELRKDFTNFQKLLAEAEEGISMLRAKLASYDGANGKSMGQKVPTVEAVEKTILKMTGMVEKKSGDIDLLETQMRKLNVLGSTIDSREGSPFVTPPTSAKKGQVVPRTPASSSSVNGGARFYTPRSGRSGFGDSIISGNGDMNGTPRKKISQITTEDLSRYSAKMKRRKEVNGLLKAALIKRGPRVIRWDED